MTTNRCYLLCIVQTSHGTLKVLLTRSSVSHRRSARWSSSSNDVILRHSRCTCSPDYAQETLHIEKIFFKFKSLAPSAKYMWGKDCYNIMRCARGMKAMVKGT